MKNLYRGAFALSFIAVSLVAIPGKASAQGFIGLPTSSTTYVDTSPMVLDHTITAPVVIDQTLTSPAVIDRTMIQPVVTTPTVITTPTVLSQPAIVAPTYMQDRSHLLNLNLPFFNFSLF